MKADLVQQEPDLAVGVERADERPLRRLLRERALEHQFLALLADAPFQADGRVAVARVRPQHDDLPAVEEVG